MRQSHSEIKAIEAELRSIRAEKTSSHARSVTLLDPNNSASNNLGPDNQSAEPERQPISPTIVRQPPQTNSASRSRPTSSPAQKRSIECFPFPAPQSAQDSTAVVRQAQLKAIVEQLRQQSFDSGYELQHSTGQVSGQRSKSVASRSAQMNLKLRNDAIWQLLEERARYINQLSAQQEVVILELMEILEQLEQDSEQNADPICECLTAEVPHVERDRNGTLVLTTRSIDWFKPEVTTAAALRYRARQQHQTSLLGSIGRLGRILWKLPWGLVRTIGAVSFAILAPVGRMVFGRNSFERNLPERHLASQNLSGQMPAAPRRKIYRGSGRRAVPETPFTLQSAAFLVVGSALLRLGLDWVVAIYPALWIPSILVMLAPALLAVYRSTVAPQTGFVWGYRLFSIMVGLLLGGRL